MPVWVRDRKCLTGKDRTGCASWKAEGGKSTRKLQGPCVDHQDCVGHLFWADHHLLIPHNNQRKPSYLQFFQTPKTPLQKSMDRLGKQLTLFSFGIIGEWDARFTLAQPDLGSLCAPGLLFQKHSWVWVTWTLGVWAETALNERFGCLIVFLVLQQQLNRLEILEILFFNWIFSTPGLIMLIGWLQGKRLLSMFTIGVRWGLQSSFLFGFKWNISRNSLFEIMDISQNRTWVRPFINTYFSCTGEMNVRFKQSGGKQNQAWGFI